MDAVESETTIYIMTERVRPLSSVLLQYSSKNSQEREDWLLWGLHRISVCRLKFPMSHRHLTPLSTLSGGFNLS